MTDSTGNGSLKAETSAEWAAFGKEGVSDVSGARQQQLASLLSKAEQYSMFIRESQVGGREGKVVELFRHVCIFVRVIYSFGIIRLRGSKLVCLRRRFAGSAVLIIISA